MNDLQKRTWAEIRLDNILHNYHAMKDYIGPGVRLLGVVKANAYGHGAVPVAKALAASGCPYLAVATAEEAVPLREAGITLPILILGRTDPAYTDELLQYGLTQAVADLPTARALSEQCARRGRTLKIHLKADSGMGRLGFVCRDGRDPGADMLSVMALPGLEAEGIFTHFAVSEVVGSPHNDQQLADFNRLCDELEKISGRKFALRHCANSGAMINYRQAHLDMVRPGIALYGLPPGPGLPDLGLRPAMSLRTRIIQIKDLHTGDTVSYGRRYTAPGPRRMAVLPIGYADGLHRVLSGKLDFLLHGRRVPQIGNICMDLCMIDVTGIPQARVGDIVTVFGEDGDEAVSADEVAEKAGTISYEVLCAVSPRVPRVYPDPAE